eukprot:m.72967 g.72967  ORF g.72967 m.72967 type:complete len:463 (-) comp24503_c0_seq1:191-1579(-)
MSSIITGARRRKERIYKLQSETEKRCRAWTWTSGLTTEFVDEFIQAASKGNGWARMGICHGRDAAERCAIVMNKEVALTSAILLGVTIMLSAAPADCVAESARNDTASAAIVYSISSGGATALYMYCLALCSIINGNVAACIRARDIYVILGHYGWVMDISIWCMWLAHLCVAISGTAAMYCCYNWEYASYVYGVLCSLVVLVSLGISRSMTNSSHATKIPVSELQFPMHTFESFKKLGLKEESDQYESAAAINTRLETWRAASGLTPQLVNTCKAKAHAGDSWMRTVLFCEPTTARENITVMHQEIGVTAALFLGVVLPLLATPPDFAQTPNDTMATKIYGIAIAIAASSFLLVIALCNSIDVNVAAAIRKCDLLRLVLKHGWLRNVVAWSMYCGYLSVITAVCCSFYDSYEWNYTTYIYSGVAVLLVFYSMYQDFTMQRDTKPPISAMKSYSAFASMSDA